MLGKQAGGSLGTFSKGIMATEFDDVVFSCALNTLQKPIQTAHGWHLIIAHNRSDVPEKGSNVLQCKLRVHFGMPEFADSIPNGILHSIACETHRQCSLSQNFAKKSTSKDFVITVIAPGGMW